MCKDGFFALYVGSFMVGIFFYKIYPDSLLLMVILFLLSLISIAIFRKIESRFFISLLVICSLSNGYIYTSLYSHTREITSQIAYQYQEIDGVVREVTSSKRGGAKIELNVGRERMMLYSEYGLSQNGHHISNLLPGDRVIFTATPKEIESFSEDFDYKSYMAGKQIFTWVYLPSQKIIVEKHHRVSIGFFFRRIKAKISNYIDKLFSNQESSAVVKSILIGDRGALTSDLKESYRKSGVYHLLALSGLHVAIIYKLILTLLFFLGNSPSSKVAKSIVIILLLLLYAAVAGFSPSISRAVIMISFYEISTYLTNRKNKLITLSFSALFILLINPNSLIDKGFQLSYLAVLSIFYIFPLLNKMLQTNNRALKKIWELLSLSISCQIATFPITFFEFGTLSPLFLISNLISVPVVTLLLNVLPVTVIASGIVPNNDFIVDIIERVILLLNNFIDLMGGINLNLLLSL